MPGLGPLTSPLRAHIPKSPIHLLETEYEIPDDDYGLSRAVCEMESFYHKKILKLW
tara:strand:+ start:1068 stop:1235 length:168 start_codon:yes stop_codon:yes gene_type:complete